MIAHGFIVVELWGNCYLALEPIKVSKKTRNMTIEFHWLRSRPRVTPLVKLLVDLTTCPDSFAEYDTPEGEEDIKLWNSTTGKELTSGRRIFLRTESPRQRPLPSFELLEMQWYLQRVVPYLLLRNSEEGQYDNTDDDSDSFMSDIDEGQDYTDDDDDDIYCGYPVCNGCLL